MNESNLATRLMRYARVSGAVGNLAMRVAGEKYLGVDINRDNHAIDLTGVLGDLKGPLMKLAQFLATVPGALPPEYADEMLKLQSNAPSMGWAFVKRRMSSELGPDWQSKFAEFSQTAAAAASLGQVHRARDLDGRDLACKLQYPDMQSTMDADLNQLKFALSLYEKWGKALETQDVYEEIQERLKEELDYTQEAKNQQFYQSIFADDPRIHVPDVVPELSTSRLLTMTWAEGVSVLSQTEEEQSVRDQLGALLFEAWYRPLYGHFVIHGDPHPGNYKIMPDGRLCLLDFGCVRHFNPKFVQGVIDLYRALQNDNRDQIVHAFENWGFSNMNNELIDVITQWAKLLYDPLLDDSVRLIQHDVAGQHSWDMATKVHSELERLGGIKPPREFVFMDRAAVGIGSVLMRLQSKQNWHQLFERIIGGCG